MTTLCPPDKALLDARFPESRLALADGAISYRRCAAAVGVGVPVVLLHGIGSGAASWLPCALALAPHADVIAWNAPGYAHSATLAQAAPDATDYARRLYQMLAAQGVERCVVVGHSLGALVAAAFAAAYPAQVARLLLLSPAQGYGTDAKRSQGAEIRQQRLDDLARLGVPGMAAERSGRMLSAAAAPAQSDWVRWNMQQLNPAGYRQAVHLLCGDAIDHYDLSGVAGAVACGSADVITTPDSARDLAARLAWPYTDIAGAGHACYIERADAVAAAIRQPVQ